ncbi:hypothetical protein O0L34_g6390 [Tuta absoluta]|nr:hypothetical protein O0L34_g6390 [Tuta absoluta]
MQPQILVLKEGTDQSQGKPQVISNINACGLVVDAVRTTLGPRGMDKLIVDHSGKAVISNDGATIMKLLDIVHPAAKTLVDIAKSQDAEVGDGTTSVVILAGELLKRMKPFVEEGVHPRIIVRAVRTAARLAVEKVHELAVKIEKKSPEEQRDLLQKCASTAMSSKLIHQQKGHFSKMVVDAVLSLDAPLLPLDMIGIKKVSGGALEDSFLVAGVAFKKTFSYAGFEMQPKSYDQCSIALLNIELELKAERDNAEVRVDNVKEYQKVVDAEWQILYSKLEALHRSGANVVLSKLPIGDVATQYFADRDMFCAGRVTEEDLRRTQRACGGAVLSSVRDLTRAALGQCSHFTERQVGGERYNIFTGEQQGRGACGGAVLSSVRDLTRAALGQCSHFTERQVGGERYNIFTGEQQGRGACGGAVLSSVRDLTRAALGQCSHFTERQVGGERYNIFTGEQQGRGACGGAVLSSVRDLTRAALGQCSHFTERQVGGERYNIFTGEQQGRGACGGAVLSSVRDLTRAALGQCSHFTERQVGGERYNIFTGEQQGRGACGGAVLSSVRDLTRAALGQCSHFTERQVGGERYNIFTGEQQGRGACGGAVLSSVRDLTRAALGQCSHFTERQVGGERYNIFTGEQQGRGACGGAVLSSVRDLTRAALGQCSHFTERQVGGERYNNFF